MQTHNADGKQRDRSQLYECAEIVTRRQQQPYGKGRRSKSVDNDQDRQSGSPQSKDGRHGGILRSPLSAPDCQQNEHESEG
jgi:hypothetical protein